MYLFEVELELVFVGDGDPEPLDVHLIVVEALAEGCEMQFAVPLRVVPYA